MAMVKVPTLTGARTGTALGSEGVFSLFFRKSLPAISSRSVALWACSRRFSWGMWLMLRLWPRGPRGLSEAIIGSSEKDMEW